MISTLTLRTGVPFWSDVFSLEGADYLLTFLYNERENCFYFSLGDPTTDPTATPVNVVDGMKLVTGKPLLTRWRGVGSPWPPGEMFAMTTNGDDTIAGLNDLGARINLVYISSDDPNLQTIIEGIGT